MTTTMYMRRQKYQQSIGTRVQSITEINWKDVAIRAFWGIGALYFAVFAIIYFAAGGLAGVLFGILFALVALSWMGVAFAGV